MTSQFNNKQTGFSLLELIVTLVILAIVMSVVVILLQQTHFQIRHISQDLSRRSLLNRTLDRLMDDLIETSKDNIDIQLKGSSTITMKTKPPPSKQNPPPPDRLGYRRRPGEPDALSKSHETLQPKRYALLPHL